MNKDTGLIDRHGNPVDPSTIFKSNRPLQEGGAIIAQSGGGMCLSLIDTEERAHIKQNERVLAEVKESVTESAYAAIFEELGESGYTYDYAIVDKPKGDDQDTDGEYGSMFVDQRGPGISGDEYNGEVYIPIGGRRWFKFAYNT